MREYITNPSKFNQYYDPSEFSVYPKSSPEDPLLPFFELAKQIAKQCIDNPDLCQSSNNEEICHNDPFNIWGTNPGPIVCKYPLQ